MLIGSTAPGTNVMTFPTGTAARIRAGTVLTFQMHYTAHGHEMKDRTAVGFKFATEMPDEEPRMGAYINGAFTLPAGQKDIAVTADLEPTEPIKIWGLLPHTHLRGARWKYTLDLPAGSKLVSTAWYDNSAGNKDNPNPKADVKWGDQSWEEMQCTGYMFTVPSRRLRPAPK